MRHRGVGPQPDELLRKAYQGDLLELLGGVPLQEHQKMTLAYDCLRGVEALLERGLVHADVKVENFLVEQRGDWFAADVADLAGVVDSSRRSASSSVAMTPKYVPPEVATAWLEIRRAFALKGWGEAAPPVGVLDAKGVAFSMGFVLYAIDAGCMPGFTEPTRAAGNLDAVLEMRARLDVDTAAAVAWSPRSKLRQIAAALFHPRREERLSLREARGWLEPLAEPCLSARRGAFEAR